MTVSSEVARVAYTGNATTGPFAIPFYFLENDDLKVIKTLTATGVETPLVLTTDYTLTGAADPLGGALTLVTALPATYKLTIIRDPDVLQGVDYTTNDKFPAATHERALDKLTMLMQRVKDIVARSLHLSDGDVSGANVTLPTPVGSSAIGWNAAGTALINIVLSTGTTLVNLAASTGSALIGWIQAGVGAVLRTVQDKLRERISVKDFGAVGDGVTDDDAAIVLAVAALKARGGGTLFFPQGSYPFTTTIAFTTGDSGCAIEGEMMGDGVSQGTSLLYNGTGWAITREHSVVNLRNFTLVGTVAALGGGLWDGKDGALVCSNCENTNLEIVSFTNAAAVGLLFYGSIRQWYRNCTFTSNYTNVKIGGPIALNSEWHTCSFINALNYGLLITAGTDHTFVNCNFEYNANQGIIIEGTGATADTIAARLKFKSCWVEGNNDAASGSATVGACQVFVGNGANAAWNTDIVFEDLFVAHNADCAYDVSVYYATRTSMIRPQFSSSYFWVDAAAINTGVLTTGEYGNVGSGFAMVLGYGAGNLGLYPVPPNAGNTTPVFTNHLAVYSTDSGAGRTITDFLGKTNGKIVVVNINDATTTIPNSAAIITAGGKTISEQGTVVAFFYDGTVWREIARNQTAGDMKSATLAAAAQSFVLVNTDSAMMMVTDITANKSAIYALNGGANTTTEMSDPDAGFQNATGGAIIAVYYDGAGSYRIKNEYAAAHDLRWTLINGVTR